MEPLEKEFDMCDDKKIDDVLDFDEIYANIRRVKPGDSDFEDAMREHNDGRNRVAEGHDFIVRQTLANIPSDVDCSSEEDDSSYDVFANFDSGGLKPGDPGFEQAKLDYLDEICTNVKVVEPGDPGFEEVMRRHNEACDRVAARHAFINQLDAEWQEAMNPSEDVIED